MKSKGIELQNYHDEHQLGYKEHIGSYDFQLLRIGSLFKEGLQFIATFDQRRAFDCPRRRDLVELVREVMKVHEETAKKTIFNG